MIASNVSVAAFRVFSKLLCDIWPCIWLQVVGAGWANEYLPGTGFNMKLRRSKLLFCLSIFHVGAFAAYVCLRQEVSNKRNNAGIRWPRLFTL